MGGDESLQQPALSGVGRGRGWRVAGLVFGEGRPGALQRALHRGHGAVELGGDLARWPVEHVAQDQHRALSWWQELNRGEVGQ